MPGLLPEDYAVQPDEHWNARQLREQVQREKVEAALSAIILPGTETVTQIRKIGFGTLCNTLGIPAPTGTGIHVTVDKDSGIVTIVTKTERKI